MISRAIGATIRKEYKFHGAQLGFLEHTGTETAVVRHGANLEGWHHGGERQSQLS